MISRRLLRIKVLKALYAHLKSESKSLTVSEKALVESIDKTYDLRCAYKAFKTLILSNLLLIIK